MTVNKQQLRTAKELRDLLQRVAQDAEYALEDFRRYADSWDETIAQVESGEQDPRAFSEVYAVERILEQLEDISHVHSGSSRASTLRQARRSALKLALGDGR